MMKVALLIIDVQKGLDDPSRGNRNNPDAESNIASLLAIWRKHGKPIIHVRHCSVEPNSTLRPELPGYDFKAEAQPLPEEKQFIKSVNSAFIGTGLEQYLHDQNISSLLIAGLVTDHCVSTSVRMAANLGFDVTLISDATATHERIGHDGIHYSANKVHNINLASLSSEFCVVRCTESVMKEFA